MKLNVKFNKEVLFRTILLIIESSPKWALIRALLIIWEGIIPLINIYLLKKVVDAVVVSINNENSTNTDDVVLIIIIWSLVNFLASAGRVMTQFTITTQQQLLSDHLQNIVHAKTSQIDYQFFEDHEYYDNFERVQKESILRCNELVAYISQTMQGLISISGLVLILMTLHWAVIIILIVTIIPSTYIKFIFAGKIHEWRRVRTSTERRANNYGQILTGAQYAKDLRIFGWMTEFKERFKIIRRDLMSEKLSLERVKAKRDLMSSSVEVLALLGVSYLIIQQGVVGAITIGSIVMYFQAFMRGQQFLSFTMEGIVKTYENRLFLEHLFQFLDLELKLVDTEQKEQSSLNFQSLSINDVTFKYPFSTKEALSEISFSAERGEILGIVGRNGSGKSSLVKLFCRLYDPQSGSITVDDNDIRDFSMHNWRNEVSTLFQDYAKFNLSLSSNITGQESSNSPEMLQAMDHAGARDILDQLNMDSSVELGKIFNNSTELSEGQWQRIALSRALYKDTSILILDEPTSHMDGASESKFLEKLSEIRSDKIIIMVSHRLSNIERCDKVILMDQGKLLDIGTHQELYLRSQLYRSLFQKEEVSN